MENENNNMNRVVSGGILAISIPQIISSILGVLFGAFFLLVVIISLFHLSYIETEATIVEVKYEEEEKEYVPVYEFQYKGRTVKVDGVGWSDKKEHTVGDKQTIRYNPKNYKQFDEGSSEETWFIFIFGLIMFSISLTFLIKMGMVFKAFVKNENVLELPPDNREW